MSDLRWHHCRSLEHVRYGVVESVRLLDVLPEPDCKSRNDCWERRRDGWHDAFDYDAAYSWMAERAGFWPIFVAVGSQQLDLEMTGYNNQFRRILTQSREGNTYRKAGEFPNDVLFSWASPPERIVYSDYDLWHIVLNSHVQGELHESRLRPVEAHWERQILRRSWPQSRWLRFAAEHPHSVQGVVPRLDLAAADRVWVRNQPTRRQLLGLGFAPEQVEVQRMRVPSW